MASTDFSEADLGYSAQFETSPVQQALERGQGGRLVAVLVGGERRLRRSGARRELLLRQASLQADLFEKA